jgi:endoglucanase
MKKFLLYVFILLVQVSIMRAQEFADAHSINQRLGRGINMGNAFEAPTETGWGNQWFPDYFKIMSELGFSHVRIPIRWNTAERSMSTAPYTIYPVFMQRIKFVVDKALENKLHPIINMHHHDDFFAAPDAGKDRFLAQWTQIAELFKDYPDSLVFELMNEPHDKLDGPKWNSFVREALDVIRPTNPKRIVMIGTSPWGGLDGVANLDLPDDDYLILTVHYYNPFEFTHQGAEWVGSQSQAWLGTKWNDTEAERESVKNQFAFTKSFAQQHNIPVHVGEFGAYSKADLDSRVRWTTFLARWFEEQNFSWAYWEFSAGFGIYNPQTKQLLNPLVNALLHNTMPQPTGYQSIPVFNDTFDNGSSPWNLYNGGGAVSNMSASGGWININITNGGSNDWNVQLVRNNLQIEKDQMYRVKFRAKADANRSVTTYIGKSSDPWTAYSGYTGNALSAEAADYTFTFTMKNNTDNTARFVFDLGKSNTNVSIDNISLDKINLLTSINQLQEESHVRFFPNPVSDMLHIEHNEFFDNVLLLDSAGRIVKSQQAGSQITTLDTSDLAPGLYILRVSGKTLTQSLKLLKAL